MSLDDNPRDGLPKIERSSELILKRHPGTFQQEYNYIYAQKGKIKKLLKNTSLEKLDYKQFYEFTFSFK